MKMRLSTAKIHSTREATRSSPPCLVVQACMMPPKLLASEGLNLDEWLMIYYSHILQKSLRVYTKGVIIPSVMLYLVEMSVSFIPWNRVNATIMEVMPRRIITWFVISKSAHACFPTTYSWNSNNVLFIPRNFSNIIFVWPYRYKQQLQLWSWRWNWYEFASWINPTKRGGTYALFYRYYVHSHGHDLCARL